MLRGMLEACFVVLFVYSTAFGAHPLITDDAGTQGTGKFQFEFNYEYEHEACDGEKEDVNQLQMVATYGINNNIDVVFALPYQYIRCASEGGARNTQAGLADIAFELKWRFYELNGFSFALKPGISFPLGDEEKGLGAGEVGGSVYFITTKEIEPWAFHFNAGYGRNENSLDERTDIWHVSLAAEVEVFEWMHAVGNVGLETNCDRHSDTPPAFILGGFIFPLAENFSFDIGVKGGLTEPESDYSLLTGITMCF